MLRSGGLIAIVEQPRGPATEAAVRGMAEALAGQLAAVGFRNVRLEFKPMRPAINVGALGTK